MSLKNHFGIRPWQLNGDQGDNVAYAHSRTIKWKMGDIPAVTNRMCNYVVGLLLTFTCTAIQYVKTGDGAQPFLSAADMARYLFESIEVQNTLFGTPVSSNHYLGQFFSLFEFVGNGMELAVPQPPLLANTSQTSQPYRHSWFIPLAALSGMKGHHTAQAAFCYDKALVQLRTAPASAGAGISAPTNGVLSMSALLLPEPELRLGPGVNFIRYATAAASAGQSLTIDSLGNATSLEGVEQGAGLAFLAWMSSRRGYGGAGLPRDLEYVNVPFRNLQQVRHFDPFFVSYLAACGGLDVPYADSLSSSISDAPNAGPVADKGFLYGPTEALNSANGLIDADFLPLIHPSKFSELSKIQSVQGTVSLGLKGANGFSGEHVVLAQQYHSWTGAKREDWVKKAVDSGAANAVWGTNDLEWSMKVANKQAADKVNPEKTRYFADTLVPRTKVSNPPSQSA